MFRCLAAVAKLDFYVSATVDFVYFVGIKSTGRKYLIIFSTNARKTFMFESKILEV